MSFTAPLFLWGLAALAVPVIIHLLARRSSRPVDFSSVMFLRPILVQTARRRRLKELLVLFLRCALLALVALALAGPVLRRELSSSGEAAIAFVLDNSGSMSYQEGGAARLERARQEIRAALAALKPGDEAAIIPTAGIPTAGAPVAEGGMGEPGEPRLEPSPQALASALESVKAFPGSGGAGRAIQKALRLLGESRLPNKMLAVLSDLQENEWKDFRLEAEEEKPPPELAVFLRELGGKDYRNLTLREVRAAAPHLAAGGLLQLEAVVENFGTAAMEAVVKLNLQGLPAEEKKVFLPEGSRLAVPFQRPLKDPGWLMGSAGLSTDPLPMDNERFFAWEVTAGVPLLIVDGAPSPIRYLDEAFFLEAALSSSARGSRGTPFAAVKVEPGGLAKVDFRDFRAVILANVEKPEETWAAKLREFVRRGGGLLVFTGDRVDPEAYNQALGDLLPLKLKKKIGSQGGDAFFTVQLAAGDHPLLRALEPREAAEGSGRGIDFSNCCLFQMNGGEPAGGVVILSAGEAKAPLLAERQAGDGKVLLFASTADADWNNLPLRTVYVPLLYGSLGYLTGKGILDNGRQAGEPDVPPAPGIHRTYDAAGVERFFAVNIDPSESRLVKKPAVEVHRLFEVSRVKTLTGEEALASAIDEARTGVPLSRTLSWAALGLLLLETFFANRMRPRAGSPSHASAAAKGGGA